MRKVVQFLVRGDTMKKIRAIYIGDIRFDQCPVFELNLDTNYFEMLTDKEFRYEKEVVEEDDHFHIFVKVRQFFLQAVCAPQQE